MSTFEVIVASIVTAVSAIVICVALAFYGKKPERIADLNIESTANNGDKIPKTPTIENSANFDESSLTETMLRRATESSQVKSEPKPVAPPVSSIGSFQASSSECNEPDTASIVTESVQHENTIPNSSNEFKDASSASSNQDFSASSEASALAIPTDNSALENISRTTLPVGAQSASPNAFNSISSSNYGNVPIAYCVKCRSKKQVRDPTAVTMKNGRAAISGFCCDCGTRVFRIGISSKS
jgi:hypothetical protein